MKKILTYIGAALVAFLAVYGAVSLVISRLDASDGKKAVEGLPPFVKGAASAAGEKIQDAIKETPDERLEKQSEELSRKLYPIAKGALKGHLEAIIKDANRGEVPAKMYEAGKDVTEKVVRPFSKGVADGSGKVLDDLDKTLQGVRKFQEDNKDLLNTVTSGIEALKKGIQENPGLLPPPPPLPRPQGLFPPRLPDSQASSPSPEAPLNK